MAVPMLDLARQHRPLMPSLAAAFDAVAASGRFILGPAVETFERDLAARCGAAHAVGTSSGTDALLMALMAIGVRPHDEVITTPFTFIATAAAAARLGATPVFVDIDPATFNIDPAGIEPAITPKTRAVVPVHLFGRPADMRPITAIAQAYGLKVVEDAAQALGAADHGTRVGTVGDVGCFSFYPTKNLPAMGDAGACCTRDPALAQRLAELRNHGQTTRYRHEHLGGNFRLDALQAAWLSVKLPFLEQWNQARRDAADRYAELLAGLPVEPPRQAPDQVHAFGQYTLRVPADHRDALRAHLDRQGIGNEVYYPTPLHLQPVFARLGHQPGRFPHAERAAAEVLSIPLFPGISPGEQEQVAAAIRGYFDKRVL